ncbi:gliding motility-associated ABC transporter substrate-binding protein GldG [Spongiivirga citrea]|uniref:Gliding motility-associated ABC transporter substrate-binding protein GldG n=1 Tax=Spongiivirga citrea TaxID=1481457 RepID=A0A6M0CIZ1_9FLAO|nr:gliding motility-associated ABC transporter substrate-binding protein GldG [Spongiivirga citrea]NER17502.1 gliding motility-associated ABC transporter substrate-binding protein GldG [Spongiivirga citrea]
MISILKKEISSFFSSPIGYLVIAIFLLVTGLFLWIFNGEFNILNSGFADLSGFFRLAPWVLLFLIPAICMRSFSEEKKQGTLDLLLIKPIGRFKIVLAKYLAAFFLTLLALIPSLLYVLTISKLGNPEGSFDSGSVLGSYIGLILVASVYTAIGSFASAITQNQIIAFVSGVFICFLFYLGFEGIAGFELFGSADLLVENFGINSHYESMGRGVVSIADICYFIGLTLLFLIATQLLLDQKIDAKKYALPIVVLGFLVGLGFTANKRFDLTEDDRYTLSEASIATIDNASSPVFIDVFLKGDFPSEFKRLQQETKQLLTEFKNNNSNIQFNFINPFEEEENTDAVTQQLVQLGLTPANVTVTENGKTSQELIVPWAMANYQNRTVRIPLMKNKLGADQEQRVANSIQQLEYAFADGFSRLVNPKKRKIAILKGNGELEDKYLIDFLSTLKESYFIAPFDLDSLYDQPGRILKNLDRFDLAIVAKPTDAFSDKEKLILDQFIMKGKSSLWLLDAVNMETDSLRQNGEALAFNRDLNLNDMLFKYGVRINPVLVNDLYSAPITLAQGQGNNARFVPVKWFYSPLADAANNHPISNNINLVKFDFANQIDTLKNNITKTILLQSSAATKTVGTPQLISLDIVQQEPNLKSYTAGHIPLAVLLEGKFTSVYKNRIKPFKMDSIVEDGKAGKMIVVADGDVIKNQFQQGRPLELGFDRWTGQQYGNKEFLLNSVNYLLNDDGLINIRSKEIKIAFLDQQKVVEERTKWQAINLVVPLIVLGLFGFVFNLFRRKKYR